MLALVGIGVAAGVGAGVFLAEFVATLLYGLPPRDLLTLAQASVLLGVVALLAC